MSKNCSICDRIELIKKNKNIYFIKKLKTGYIVLGDHQFYKGYTVFISQKHTNELHKLSVKNRITFLMEMSLVAEAVYQCFKPKKLNYELLGNTDSHLHWHIFPRYKNDPYHRWPVWQNPNLKKILKTKKYHPTAMEGKMLKNKIRLCINKLLKQQ